MNADAATQPAHHDVIVIGAGFGGLGAGIRLKAAGHDDFLIVERDAGVGGTWYANRYPGAACDIPSVLYSFSFAPWRHWSRRFPGQAELRAYLEHCVRRFGLEAHLRLSTEVVASRWVDSARHWRLETRTAGGVPQVLSCRVLIAATGGLSRPSMPELPGLAQFAGPVFHSARWPADIELDGLRVGVVGTGASAIQLVPKLVPRVAQLTLFQRTAPWVLPKGDRALRPLERWLFAHVPLAQRLSRAAAYAAHESRAAAFTRRPQLLEAAEPMVLHHLQRKVRDPALRAALTPDYRMGCKRILLSDDFYPALQQRNLRLVCAGIERIGPRGVRTRDGAEHRLDALVMATGFDAARGPLRFPLLGRDGLALEEAWRDGPAAHLGCTVSGFPNLFLIAGPNTGLGHNSMIMMIESQLNHVLDALVRMRTRRLSSVEVRAEVQRRFNDEIQGRLQGTVWATGGCSSWYQLALEGRPPKITTLWPGGTLEFRRRARRFRLDEHHACPA